MTRLIGGKPSTRAHPRRGATAPPSRGDWTPAGAGTTATAENCPILTVPVAHRAANRVGLV